MHILVCIHIYMCIDAEPAIYQLSHTDIQCVTYEISYVYKLLEDLSKCYLYFRCIFVLPGTNMNMDYSFSALSDLKFVFTDKNILQNSHWDLTKSQNKTALNPCFFIRLVLAILKKYAI